MVESFLAEGYRLAVSESEPGSPDQLLEVYPHPALLSLLGCAYRVPYKVSRSKQYWKEASAEERIVKLLDQFATILGALQSQIEGIPLKLPLPAQVRTLAELKPFEDMLDALVCAWIGIKYLDHEVECLGDETSAIWIPRSIGN